VAQEVSRLDERAAVSYQAPHGIEALTLCDGEVVAFGRGTECKVRFGYAPQPDQDVPRVAGYLIVGHERVFIESSATVGHRALEVRTGGGKSVQIPIGEGYSPRDTRFDILVRGSGRPWKLGITTKVSSVMRGDGLATDPPTSHFLLALTDVQRAVVEAYLEPVRRGRVEPATHKEVAARLNRHPNTVRETLYEVWTLLFELDIPMLDTSDKRIAVVEAVRIHGLLPIKDA
jgi:hypothetical protein